MVSLFLLLGCNLSDIVDLFDALQELASASARTLLKFASSVRALLKPYGDTLTSFIYTVIGPNLTSCHLKLIFVTPLGSKTRKLGAFGSYIPADCSKTGLERNVFQSQNLQP